MVPLLIQFASMGCLTVLRSKEYEPLATYRAHLGAVHSVAISPSNGRCYSAGMDASIFVWPIPDRNWDSSSSFGKWGGCVIRRKERR